MQGIAPLPNNLPLIGSIHLETDNPLDTLSEVSIQEQRNDTVASVTPPTSVTRTIPATVTTITVSHKPQLGTMSLPPITPRMIKSPLLSLSILLHYYQMP